MPPSPVVNLFTTLYHFIVVLQTRKSHTLENKPVQGCTMNQMQLEQEGLSQSERPSLRQRIFGPPRLPNVMVWTAVLVIISLSLLILNNQRADYWFDLSLGVVGHPWLDQAIRISPLLFFGIFVGYALIIYLLLRFLHFQIAIIIWAGATLFHVRDIVAWMQCNVWRVLQIPNQSCDSWRIGLTIFFAVIIGFVIAASLRPAIDATIASRRSRIVLPLTILVTIWFLGLIVWLGWNWFAPIDGWIPIPVDNPPPPRISSAIAYDSARETAVLFGGGDNWQGANWYDYETLNDTWLWNGNDWEQKTVTTAPPARFSHQMAYDPIRERIVLFGGQTKDHSLGDTWEWDGTKWHEHHPETSPPARCCHVMFFDTQRGNIVVSSGLQTPEYFFSDLWEWDGENWAQINEAYTPQFSGYASAYSSKRGMGVTLVGSDTWIWQNGQWTFDQTTDISCRADASMTYDVSRHLYVLYGGQSSNCFHNDTWTFDGESWTKVEFKNTPGGFSRHVLFYDEKRRSVMMFGGANSKGNHNRLWELHWPTADSE